MHKSFFVFMFLLFTLTNTYAKDTTIYETGTYMSGTYVMDVRTTPGSDMAIDSIMFASGLTVKISHAVLGMQHMTHQDWCVLSFTDSLMEKSGFRADFVPLKYIKEPIGSGKDTCKYVDGSSDTIWEKNGKFPIVLDLFDRIFGNNVAEDISGKIINVNGSYYDEEFMTFSTFSDNIMGYSTISYVKTLDNRHFRFQVSEMDLFPSGTGTVKIRWATDSCGNGIFNPDNVGTLGDKFTSTDHTKPGIKAFSIGNNHLILNSQIANLPTKVTIFSLDGKSVFNTELFMKPAINLSSLASGTYYIQLVNAKSVIRSDIFLKR